MGPDLDLLELAELQDRVDRVDLPGHQALRGHQVLQEPLDQADRQERPEQQALLEHLEHRVHPGLTETYIEQPLPIRLHLEIPGP